MKQLSLISLLLPLCFLLGFTPEDNLVPSKSLDDSGLVKDSEQIFLKHADACLDMMEKEAKNIPMEGVAMLAYIPGEATAAWTSKMRVVGKLADEKVNLLAIAYAKAGEMAVTQKDSGEQSRKEIGGELGDQGGAIIKIHSGYLVAAFSGGTSEDDLAVSKMGLDWLSKKF